METWLEWARGPIFRGALVFMILGLARHVALTIYQVYRAMARAGDKRLPYRALARATLEWLLPLGRVKDRPFYSATTVAFHVSILAVPLFLAGHVALWRRGLGWGWPSIPNALADALTVLAVAGALALVIQRVAARATRALSRPGDYAMPLLITVPFISGWLLMHPSLNPFAFGSTMLVHVLSAELIMVLIPVTKLSHCVLLPTTQVISEVAWHFPPSAGSEVGAILGKENEPV